MKRINEKVVIASDHEMIEAGLVKCNPREGVLTLWIYMKNILLNKMQWTPIVGVTVDPLAEDVKDVDGNIIKEKTTHCIDTFYGSLTSGRFNLVNFLRKKGVNVECYDNSSGGDADPVSSFSSKYLKQ